jgi:hypothetical protein
MNQETGEPQQQDADSKSEKGHAPIAVAHAAKSEKDAPKSADDCKDGRDLLQVTRWDRFKKWFSAVTIVEVGMLIFTAVIAVSTFYYTKYARRQWKVMSEQLTEMQKANRASAESFAQTLGQMKAQTAVQQDATDAAKNAADTAHDALVKGNRPWLGVYGTPTVLQVPKVDTKIGIATSIGLTVKNFGTAPALHVGVHLITVTIPYTSDVKAYFKDFENTANASCRMADLTSRPAVPGEEGSGPYIFPDNTFSYIFNGTARSGESVTTQEMNSSLRLVGCIVYVDQFKVVHHTRFCFRTEVPVINVKTGQPFTACPINQSAD